VKILIESLSDYITVSYRLKVVRNWGGVELLHNVEVTVRGRMSLTMRKSQDAKKQTKLPEATGVRLANSLLIGYP
jgi:hypothetical protein